MQGKRRTLAVGPWHERNSVDDCQDWQLTLELIFNLELNAFVAEVCRRMPLRHSYERPQPSFAEIQNDLRVLLAVTVYGSLLPIQGNAAILESHSGVWFIAPCLKP